MRVPILSLGQLLGCLMTVFLAACSALPASNEIVEAPEISRLELEFSKAQAAQAGLLAPREMDQAELHLNQAQALYGVSASEAQWHLLKARTALRRARFHHERRREALADALMAREGALFAIHNLAEEGRCGFCERLKRLDQRWRHLSEDWERSSRIDRRARDVWSTLARQYSNLRVAAVQERTVRGR